MKRYLLYAFCLVALLAGLVSGDPLGGLNSTQEIPILVGGKVPTAQLGSGTADATTFLRGDQNYAAPTGSGDITDVWGCSAGNCNALTAAAGDSLNAGSADATAPIKVGTAPPATCAVGEYFFDSDATAGQNTYGCTATNVWTLQGAGGTATGEGARVRRVATQSIPNATDTAISWDTEDIDDNAYYTAGNPTRLTVPATGWYTGCTSVAWDAAGNISVYMHHAINGGNIWLDQTTFAATQYATRCWSDHLSAGDYIETIVFQNSGISHSLTARSTIKR